MNPPAPVPAAPTWLGPFMQMLTENVTVDQLAEAIGRVAVITFNYDRTFEHFLKHALWTYYRLTEAEAEKFARSLVVHHPYGSLGKLQWQDPQQSRTQRSY